jgi:hypothetical protein
MTQIISTVHRIVPHLVDVAKSKTLKRRRRRPYYESWPKAEQARRLQEAIERNQRLGIGDPRPRRAIIKALANTRKRHRPVTLPKLECLT